MTTQEWLAVLGRLAGDVRHEAGALVGTEAGGAEVGTVGAGGDLTLEVDQRAEDVVMAGLRDLAEGGERFSVLSEEIGLVEFGAEYPRVVVDPIDGSPNARRGLRMVGVMLSLLEGPSVGDVVAGMTVDLTSGERWSVVRGEGVAHNGHPLRPMRLTHGQQIDVLGLHALPNDIELAWPLLREVATFRQMYCMSLSLVYTAGGGIDVFCSPRRARIFDLTAGLLTIREVGGLVSDLEGGGIEELPVDLETRTTLLCSAHPDLHRLAVELANQGSSGPRRS
jgi:myo-inositol-1(or 4)-monophosphatase